MRIRGSKPLFGSPFKPEVHCEKNAWEFVCALFTRRNRRHERLVHVAGRHGTRRRRRKTAEPDPATDFAGTLSPGEVNPLPGPDGRG
jgi:hypothetical protein